MQYTTLGETGIEASRLCLGAMMFGAFGNRDHHECVRLIHQALAAGINFIDTADVYSSGESESIVAEAIAGRRDSVVLATKFSLPMQGEPASGGASRRWLERAIDDSLRRLRTDYVDLYQIHRFDEQTPLEETLAALTDLVRAGKIRAFGSSMFSADRIVEARWIAEKRSLVALECEQSRYSLLAREVESAVLPVCRRYSIANVAFSPLANGWLSGRYLCEADLEKGGRAARMERHSNLGPEALRAKLTIVRQLSALAREANTPLTQLAVAFVLEHPAVASVVIGPRTPEQLVDLLAACDRRLETNVLDAIDRIVPPGTNVEPLDPMSRPKSLDAVQRRR